AGIVDYEPLRDGEDLVMAGETFHVLHTPGHSPGSVTFAVGSDQIVGDLILPGSVGRTDISGASWEEIEVSIRKVMPLWDGTTRLFTGHGPVLHAMEELETNPYLPLGMVCPTGDRGAPTTSTRAAGRARSHTSGRRCGLG
ncbi:MAG: MBL fold metallo-hydrolase, partial [Actinomycetota bacterium]|nr:MBL fold metallo-hydrolase [Actinomycetota bacterium]